MADFVAVLKKTIDGLGETTPEIREKVYQKARLTVGARLAAINPPPPAAVAERQRQTLEDAIRKIEADYAAKAPAADPLAELDALFAELKPKPKAVAPTPAAPAGPAAAKPAPTAPATPSPRQAAPAEPKPTPTRAETAAPSPVAAHSVVRPEPAAGPVPDQTPVYDEELPDFDEPLPRSKRVRPGMGPWLAVVAVLLVFAGAGYGVYLNKDSFLALFDGGPQIAAVEPVADEEPEAAPATEEPAEEVARVEEAPAAPATPAPEPENGKFTQRLNADGSESDPGPAGGEPTRGEGTSMAAATLPADSAAPSPAMTDTDAEAEGGETGAPVAAEPPPAVAVGQKAIFYEERTSSAEGSADTGSIVWSLAQESPGGDLPPEPVIRAEASIPAKDLQLRMTIRRNGDDTLPASHIVELIFLTPDDFASGPIDNVLRMTMKETEQAAGSALIGIPAKIADGFFLVALNDGEREVQTNTQLMQRQRWIDVPIVYKSGRRALITMEKGIPGERVFDEALKAWQSASSG